jgi:hypothetical protein
MRTSLAAGFVDEPGRSTQAKVRAWPRADLPLRLRDDGRGGDRSGVGERAEDHVEAEESDRRAHG